MLFIEVHPKLIRDYGGDARTMLRILLDAGFNVRYIVISRRSSLLSIRRYIKPKTRIREQVIEYNAPLNDPLHDSTISQILKEPNAFRLFMERSDISAMRRD